MSYTKQNWEDRDLGVGVNGTPVNAEHLNHIEDGIEQNAEDIAAVNADLTDIEGSRFSSTEDLFEYASTNMSNGQFRFLSTTNSSFLTNGDSSSSGKGWMYKQSSTSVDFLITVGEGGWMYTGRITSGELSKCTRFSATTSILSLPIGDEESLED